MKNENLPIGYWLKLADESLTKGVDKIQSTFKINRIGWQILNSLNEKRSMTKSEVTQLMKPFADTEMVEDILTDFSSIGLIKLQHEQVLMLTQKGQELYQLCLKQQQLFRQKAMAEITQQDYLTTISTLKKIIENINKTEE